jgi:potassium-dependent mechanosensitive channel
MTAVMAQPLSARRTRAVPLRSLAQLLAILCLAAFANAQKPPIPFGSLLTGSQSKPATPAAAPASNVQPEAPKPPAAIPLPDVASRSEELKRMLRSASSQMPTPDQLQQATAALDEEDAEFGARTRSVDTLLNGTPSTLELREEENYWRTERDSTADLRTQLLTWANAAQSAVQEIQTQEPMWQATLDQNQQTPDLGPALDLIKQSVAQMKLLLTQAQDQLRTIVNLQVRAASQDQLASDTLERLKLAREAVDGHLLDRDSLPLWEIAERRQLGENKESFLAASARLQGIRAFARASKGALMLLFLLLLASLFGAYRLHQATLNLQPESDRQAEVLRIAHHWFALGLLPPLLFAFLLAPLAPLPLIGLVILVSFIPILILLPPVISPRLRMLLYSLTGVYTFSAFVAWIGFSPVHKREIQFVVTLGIFLLFAYLVRPSRIKHTEPQTRIQKLRVLVIQMVIAIVGVALVANLFGYVKLSQFLGVLCLYSTFVAVSMMTGVHVFTRLLLEGIETPHAQQLALVRSYSDGVARWLPRVFKWCGTLVWFLVTINLLGLGTWLTDTLERLSNFHIAGSTSSVTLGGVLGFFLILLGGYAISTSLRFLLREEVLNRFHLARGVPDVIASTVHYLFLLLVFFFAVNAGGVELNKFTVLTGALGVGVGFGLQNIVNNFISGLILQFERPIHIGDVLEVDGANGQVTRIGIRSSTVRTFQGAELIIPNGNLISGKVINWTLTESRRRVDLLIGVAYGSDVKLVLELLERAATAHESVLTTPPPVAYFKEFADSAVNFEAQFWVMQESNTTRVKSEVALSVIASLDEAGIEIPFPQRDLRLRSVNPDAAAALQSPNGASNAYAGEAAEHREPEPVLERARRQTGE